MVELERHTEASHPDVDRHTKKRRKKEEEEKKVKRELAYTTLDGTTASTPSVVESRSRAWVFTDPRGTFSPDVPSLASGTKTYKNKRKKRAVFNRALMSFPFSIAL